MSTKKKITSLLLSVLLMLQLSACGTAGKADAGDESKMDGLTGNAFFGYMAIPDDWKVVPNILADPAFEEYTRNYENLAPLLQTVEYATPENDLRIRTAVSIASGMEEALFTARRHDSIGEVLSFAEQTITLDDGKLDPVYKFDLQLTELNPDTGEQMIVYVALYDFVGFDGLVRTINVGALNEELLSKGTTIIEDTFSFMCDPADQTVIRINGIERREVVNQSGVVITLIGYYEESAYGKKLNYIIENNTGETISIRPASLSINGTEAEEELYFYDPYPIEAGASRLSNITLRTSQLTDAGIDSVQTFEFVFQVYSADQNALLFESDVITVKPLSLH